jgi:hypothetical protein
MGASLMAGERQLVRLAVAAFFGGSLATDGEVKYQGGPLVAYGLGTAYPYSVRHYPDTDFTAGQPAGQNYGFVLSTTAIERATKLDSYGGPSSGFWERTYMITCDVALLCELEHIETAEAALDDLIDEMHALVYADRTLGTLGSPSVQVLQAGAGKGGIRDKTDRLVEIDAAKGRYTGQASVTFQALTMVTQ